MRGLRGVAGVGAFFGGGGGVGCGPDGGACDEGRAGGGGGRRAAIRGAVGLRAAEGRHVRAGRDGGRFLGQRCNCEEQLLVAAERNVVEPDCGKFAGARRAWLSAVLHVFDYCEGHFVFLCFLVVCFPGFSILTLLVLDLQRFIWDSRESGIHSLFLFFSLRCCWWAVAL